MPCTHFVQSAVLPELVGLLTRKIDSIVGIRRQNIFISGLKTPTIDSADPDYRFVRAEQFLNSRHHRQQLGLSNRLVDVNPVPGLELRESTIFLPAGLSRLLRQLGTPALPKELRRPGTT